MKTFAVWLAVVVGTLAPAARAQSAREIIDRTVARYTDLQDYRFEGAVDLSMEAGGDRRDIDIVVKMAERRPDFIRADVTSPVVDVRIVSNGDSTWFYLPEVNQFMRKAGGFNPAAMGGTVPDLLAEYATLADSTATLALLREEPVPVAGGTRPAYVLSIAFAPRPTAVGADSVRKTLWIDREHFVVLRDETHAHISESQAGAPMTIDETTTFSVADFTGPVPDSLFVFRAPAGATEVKPEDVAAEAAAQEQAEIGGGSPLVGQPAQDFTLRSLAGEEVSLASLRGKVVLLNFWATWCGPCRTEMPALQNLYAQYADRGLVVLGVDLEETPAEVQAFVDEHRLTFPIVIDSDGAVGLRYGATGIPMSVIINREGLVVQVLSGARPEEVFRGALMQAGLE